MRLSITLYNCILKNSKSVFLKKPKPPVCLLLQAPEAEVLGKSLIGKLSWMCAKYFKRQKRQKILLPFHCLDSTDQMRGYPEGLTTVNTFNCTTGRLSINTLQKI